MEKQTIRHRVTGEVFTIEYRIVDLPTVWPRRGKEFERIWWAW